MRKLFAPLVAATLVLTIVGPASAVDDINTTKLRQAVTVGGILAHERVFQRIANQNDGTRASGTPGYDASAAYVKQTLQEGRLQGRPSRSSLPVLPGAGPGRARAALADAHRLRDRHVRLTRAAATSPASSCPTNDIVIPPTPAPSSTIGLRGRRLPAGAAPSRPVALIQRGTCTFEDKAENAEAAGYDAAIIFNEGQPGRDDLFIGTLGDPVEHPGRRAQLRRRRGAVRPDPGRPGHRPRVPRRPK